MPASKIAVKIQSGGQEIKVAHGDKEGIGGVHKTL